MLEDRATRQLSMEYAGLEFESAGQVYVISRFLREGVLVFRLDDNGLPQGSPFVVPPSQLPRVLADEERSEEIAKAFGSGVVRLARVYLKRNEPDRDGVEVRVGPRGGRYYESDGSPSKEIELFKPRNKATGTYRASVEALMALVENDELKNLKPWEYYAHEDFLVQMFAAGDERADEILDKLNQYYAVNFKKMRQGDFQYPHFNNKVNGEWRKRAVDETGFARVYLIPGMKGVGFADRIGAKDYINDKKLGRTTDGRWIEANAFVSPVYIPIQSLKMEGGIGPRVYVFDESAVPQMDEAEAVAFLRENGLMRMSLEGYDRSVEFMRSQGYGVKKFGPIAAHIKYVLENSLEISRELKNDMELWSTDPAHVAQQIIPLRQKYGPVLEPVEWPEMDALPPSPPWGEEGYVPIETRQSILAREVGAIGYLHTPAGPFPQAPRPVYSDGNDIEPGFRPSFVERWSDIYDGRARSSPRARPVGAPSHIHRVMTEFSRIQKRWPALRVALRDVIIGSYKSHAASATNGQGGRSLILLSEDWGNPDIDSETGRRFHMKGAAATVEDTFRHEFGHAIDEGVADNFAKLLSASLGYGEEAGLLFSIYGPVSTPGTDIFRDVVKERYGIYAATNVAEMWASCFAIYTHPDYGVDPEIPQFPQKVEEYFEALLSKPSFPYWKPEMGDSPQRTPRHDEDPIRLMPKKARQDLPQTV